MTGPRDHRDALHEIITPSVDARVDSELAFHIVMRTRELIVRGMSADDARREAVRRFGDLAGVSSDLVKIGKQTEGILRRARFVAEAPHSSDTWCPASSRRSAYGSWQAGSSTATTARRARWLPS
ncbi:MAG: permease prefix domain 1-containing protein [Gemmatimonadaceae bacterium]